MFAHVTSLRHWKSERADITTCEDALRSDVQHGLFCVADGAGTTLFSNIWADILVEQFVHNPLMTSDVFEMEWWIRQAQKRYHDLAPTSDKLNWNAKQKALEQGAYSTLATLRFTRSDARSATAELLAVGDSCVIIGYSRKQQIASFPLQQVQDFDRAPYCLPSLLRNLNRYTLYTKTCEVTLSPNDIVILATDAVARWIISGGESGNESYAWKAFLEVAQKTESDWPGFINACRADQSIVDDDSTAIIIQLREEGREEECLGVSAAPRQETVALRKAEFEQARSENNKELVAITYGDGRMLNTTNIFLSDTEKAKAREVADALRDVLQAMRDAVNTSNFAAKAELVWWQHADLLMDEPCAKNIRNSLTAQGVRLKRPANPQASAQPLAPYPQGGNHPNQLPLHAVVPGDGTSFQQLTGVEPEVARILTPSLLAPAFKEGQQEQADLQAFREALVARDPLAIANTYHPSLDGDLTLEEKIHLQDAQARLQLELSNRLRVVLDQNDDDALLAVAASIESAPVEIIYTESEKQRIHQARERQAAFDRLLNALEEGTAFQKVEAAKLAQKRKSLSVVDQEQLGMAQHLVEAMRSNKDDRISSAYEMIEFSPLRKHFIFTLEEQRRIEQARQMRSMIEQFRMILQSGTATIALLMRTYELIHTPGSYLSTDELHMMDLAQRFLHYYQSSQQAFQSKDVERMECLVRLYDALYYSPYQIAFTEDEARQVNNAKKNVNPNFPLIMMVNQVPVNISQFLALFHIRKLNTRSQIALLKRRLASNPPEPERQRFTRDIDSWEKQIERRNLPVTVLKDLLHQVLLEQKISEEIARGNAKRGNVNLEKDVKRETDELARELRAAAGKDARSSLAQFSEQGLRDALMPIALYRVFDRYLQATAPGQTLSNWLHGRRNAAALYYERPEEHAPTTTDQQRCWLFKWWFIRDSYTTTMQEEGV